MKSFFLKYRTALSVAAVWLTLALGFYRGIRWPSAWVNSHYNFDYRYGFIRRGLVGELLHTFSGSVTPLSWIHAIATTQTVINYLLFGLLLSRTIRDKPEYFLFTLLAAASVASDFLAHLNGYFDHFGITIVLLASLLRSSRKRFIWVTISMPIAIVVHEANFVLFFPLLLILQRDSDVSWRRLAVQSLLMTGLFFTMRAFSLSLENAAHLFQATAKEASYSLELVAYAVLAANLENYLVLIDKFWASPTVQRQFVLEVFSILPTVALLIWSYRSRVSSLVAFSPLLLCFVAYDVNRWLALTIFNVIVLTLRNHHDVVISKRMQLIAFVLVCFNMTSVGPVSYFDDMKPRSLWSLTSFIN